MEFGGGKPATVAGTLLQNNSDNLSQADRADILVKERCKWSQKRRDFPIIGAQE